MGECQKNHTKFTFLRISVLNLKLHSHFDKSNAFKQM